jgi:hypothetical protein
MLLEKLLYISLVSFSLSPSVRPLYGLCLNKQIRACRLSTRSWKSQLAVSTYRAPLIYIELTYTHRSREHKQFLLRAYKGKGLMKQTIAFTFVICLLRAHPFSLSVSLQIGALTRMRRTRIITQSARSNFAIVKNHRANTHAEQCFWLRAASTQL